MAEMSEEQRKKFSKIGKSNVSTSKAHERRVKNLLTTWSGHEFRRRRIEGRGDDVAVVEGVADIIPVNDETIFAIEAKKEKDFSLDSLLANPKNNHKFTKWWHQTCYDAKIISDKTGTAKYPLLFFKPHPNWDWVAISRKPFEKRIITPKADVPHNWNVYSDVWFPHLSFDAFAYIGEVEKNISRSKNNPVMHALELEPCFICRWNDFADNVDPESIFVKNN